MKAMKGRAKAAMYPLQYLHVLHGENKKMATYIDFFRITDTINVSI